MTDAITLILSFYFLIRGASRGFMRSLFVPVSIIVATIISLIYFQTTNDIIGSLVIGLTGPIILHILLKILLKKWAQLTNTEIKPDLLSRFCGALLTLAWGWVFILFTLILLAALPLWGTRIVAVHKDIVNSASYFFAKPVGEMLFSPSKGIMKTSAADNSPKDLKSITEDPRFQNVLQDPEIQKEIDAHQMAKLMSNPKIIDLTQQIMRDPAAMKKIMALYTAQTESAFKDR